MPTQPSKSQQTPQAISGASPEQGHLPCPRCSSNNTKFCYFNNYNSAQPRYFCKACRRYWTQGGALRNIPIGGGTRKNSNKRIRTSEREFSTSPTTSEVTECNGNTLFQMNSSGSFSAMMNSSVPRTEYVGFGWDNMGIGGGLGVWSSLMNLGNVDGGDMWQSENNYMVWPDLTISTAPMKTLK
ncbi:hypothetical protein ACHQM5_023389 [Ranunculus cassubicifolius]